MKKDFVIWLMVSIVIMLLFPFLAVTFVKADAGMAVCFILFYSVDPVYSVVIGIFAGKDIKRLWSLLIISAILFLAETWLLFDMGEIAFIMYAVIYLILGMLAMLVSFFISKKARQ